MEVGGQRKISRTPEAATTSTTSPAAEAEEKEEQGQEGGGAMRTSGGSVGQQQQQQHGAEGDEKEEEPQKKLEEGELKEAVNAASRAFTAGVLRGLSRGQPLPSFACPSSLSSSSLSSSSLSSSSLSSSFPSPSAASELHSVWLRSAVANVNAASLRASYWAASERTELQMSASGELQLTGPTTESDDSPGALALLYATGLRQALPNKKNDGGTSGAASAISSGASATIGRGEEHITVEGEPAAFECVHIWCIPSADCLLFVSELRRRFIQKIQEDNLNSVQQEARLDEMILFCISQFLNELSMVSSEASSYRAHKLIGLNKELMQMAKACPTLCSFFSCCLLTDTPGGWWLGTMARSSMAAMMMLPPKSWFSPRTGSRKATPSVSCALRLWHDRSSCCNYLSALCSPLRQSLLRADVLTGRL